MGSNGRGVYIRVRVKPGKRDEFIGLVTELARNVKANEPATQVFEILQAADPQEFVFFERFEDKAAQDRHQNAPYHVAMAVAGWACLEDGTHIEQLTPITP